MKVFAGFINNFPAKGFKQRTTVERSVATTVAQSIAVGCLTPKN
jgi:hypothetical protein